MKADFSPASVPSRATTPEGLRLTPPSHPLAEKIRQRDLHHELLRAIEHVGRKRGLVCHWVWHWLRANGNCRCEDEARFAERGYEELAGVMWRKRRLRLAEAAAHRRGLGNSFSEYGNTAKAALAHVAKADESMDVSEAVHATPDSTEDELRDLDEDEGMTRRALEILASQRDDPTTLL